MTDKDKIDLLHNLNIDTGLGEASEIDDRPVTRKEFNDALLLMQDRNRRFIDRNNYTRKFCKSVHTELLAVIYRLRVYPTREEMEKFHHILTHNRVYLEHDDYKKLMSEMESWFSLLKKQKEQIHTSHVYEMIEQLQDKVSKLMFNVSKIMEKI